MSDYYQCRDCGWLVCIDEDHECRYNDDLWADDVAPADRAGEERLR